MHVRHNECVHFFGWEAWIKRMTTNIMVWCSLHCDRRSVDKFVSVSGTPLKPMTRFDLYNFFRNNYFVAVLVQRPLWRHDASVTCSAIGNWSGSRRTINLILPSHMRLMCSFFVVPYVSQGLRWRYSNPSPHEDDNTDFIL
jgi:hypothetical protein